MARLMSFGDAPPPSSRAHDDSRSASDDHDDPEPSSEAPRAVKKRRKRRKALTTEEDVAILRAVAAVRPHHAAHGQGRRRWQEAADRVVAECGNELSATLCKGRFDNMLKRFVQEQETGGLWPRDATRRELVMAALEDQKALGDKVLRPENGASWKKRMLEMDLRRDDATAEPQDKPKDKAPLAKHKTTNASPMRTTTTNAAPTVANSATPTNANVNANANARATTTATSSSPAPMRASSTSQPLRTVLTPPRPGMGNVGRGAYIVANRMGGSPGKSRNGPPPHAHDRTRLTPPTRPSPTPERALPSLSVVPRPASASAAGPVSNKNAPGAKSAATTTTALAVPGRQSSTTTSSGLQKVARSQSTSSAVPANLLWPLYNPAPLANGGLPWNVVRANAINMINGSGQGPSAPPNGPPPQSGPPPPKTGPPPQGSGPPPPPGSAPPAPTGSDDRDRSRLPSVASVSQSAHQILAAARSEAPVPTILKSSVSRPPPSQAAPTSSSPRPPPSQPPSQPPPQPSPQQPTARSPARPPADSVHPVPADSMQRREEHIREPRQEQRPQGPAPEGHIVPLRPPSTTDSPNERRSFVESALFTMLDRFTEMERAWLRDRDQDRELRRRAAAANRSPRGDNGGYEPSDVSREEFDEVVLEMAASRRERAGLRQEIDSLTNALARSEYEQSMMREQMASLASLVRESRRENYELKQDVGSLASMLREVTGQSGALRELEAAQQRQAEELRRYQQDEESRRRIAQIDDRVRYETLEQRIEQLEHSGEAENEEPQGEPASGEEGAQDQTQTATSQQTRAENPRARTRTFNPFAELQATMEKQQELIKLYEQAQTMRDSHSRTEFEIAELKTAIDVERAERTREYMALLDNIKRVLAVDGGNEDRA